MEGIWNEVVSEKITVSSCLAHIDTETPVGHLSANDFQASGNTELWEETSQGQGYRERLDVISIKMEVSDRLLGSLRA